MMLVQELARVSGTFHDLKARLREHQEVIARSFHELYAPLVAIRSHADYLFRGLSKEPKEPHRPLSLHLTKCANIRADAENLLQIVEAMDAAGHERAPVLERTWLLASAIIPLRFGLNELAKRRGYAQLDVTAGDLRSLPKVWIDPGRMRQVFYNLLVNAIKYGPGGSAALRVQITWTADKSHYRVAIKDWGMGIPVGHETKVFQQYHRSDEAVARDPTGSGIGLFVVKRIVEMHGGTIAVTQNRGPTEFTMALPKELKR